MKMKESKKPSLVLVMIIYLFGVFMGAIDTGIVTPARTIIVYLTAAIAAIVALVFLLFYKLKKAEMALD